MKRNRKVKKHSNFTLNSAGVVVLLLTGFMMAMVYWILDSQCSSIAREIGKAEKRYAALEAECVQETARWESLKTPERLSEKLLRFGLEMKYARQDQIVRMTADGRPANGQLSVTRARQRMRTDAMASMESGATGKTRLTPAVVSTSRRAATTRR